jgi:hypothetical protein
MKNNDDNDDDDYGGGGGLLAHEVAQSVLTYQCWGELSPHPTRL